MATILLDVGGRVFKTTMATLASQSDSFFTQMMQSEWKERTQESPIFIDRDHECFELILNFLRSRRLCIDESTPDAYLKKVSVILIEISHYDA